MVLRLVVRNTNGWPSSIQLTFDDEPAPPAFAVAIWKENHKNTPVFMLPITADQSRDDSMYRLLSKYLSDNKRVRLSPTFSRSL